MPFHKSFGRSYLTHGAALAKARQKYPYRLVRAHSAEPDPQVLQRAGVFNHFARFPSKAGDEWLFDSALNRDIFHAKYGGTILGE